MTFTYTKITGHYFCQSSDEWEEDGIEFDYEVEESEVDKEIAKLVERDFEIKQENVISFLNEVYGWESVRKYYYNELQDIFKERAFEGYEV